MSGFAVWCPLCGGPVTDTGEQSAGHQRGECDSCGEALTVVVSADCAGGRVNRNAPFFHLVALIDRAQRDNRRAATMSTPHSHGQTAPSTGEQVSSPAHLHAHPVTIEGPPNPRMEVPA